MQVILLLYSSHILLAHYIRLSEHSERTEKRISNYDKGRKEFIKYDPQIPKLLNLGMNGRPDRMPAGNEQFTNCRVSQNNKDF
jgi:hypothetical protein